MISYYQKMRRMTIFAVGGSVLLCGFALLFIPGPAIVVIPLGLTILATEFMWARRIVDKAKQKINMFKKERKH